MAIKLEVLRIYATVVESGTLVDAAERVGRTPAALSMTLKQLEGELGGSLFESDRKRRPTPLGRFAYGEARRAITVFDEIVTSVRRFARGELGLVRVVAVRTILIFTVRRSAASPLVAEFIDDLANTVQRYPWYSDRENR